MRILKRVEIFNFQSHKHSVIELSPSGLTVITGASHHGKSAVVRAVRWVLYNRPQGNEFFRHGTKESKVILTYNDGISIERRKTVSLNQYWIRFADENKKDELYEGFGYDVPLEVQKITGCYNYKIDDNKTLYLNIAEQGEGLFLGSKTATDTQRAKILGKLAGTEDVDRANKKLGTDIYRAEQDKKKLEAEIKEKDEKIKEYAWVEPLGGKLEKLGQIRDKVGKDCSKLELLEQKKKQLEQIDADILQIEKRLEWYYDVLPDVYQIISGIEPDMPLLVDLVKKEGNLLSLTGQINDQLYVIKNSGQPDDALKQINDINIKINQLENKEQKLQRLIGLNRKIIQADIEIGQNRVAVKNCGNPVEAIKILNQCSTDINRSQRILDNWNILIDVREDIRILKLRLTHYQGIDESKSILADTNTKLTKLSELHNRKSNYDERKKQLNYYTQEIVVQKDALPRYKQLANQAKEEYKAVFKEAGVCPYCGNKVNDECLDYVV